MAELKIVAADGIKGPGLEMLREAFGDAALEVRGKYTEDELCEAIGGIDALLVRSGTKVTRKAFESGQRIRLVGRAGVGTDNIDKQAATERGVVVMNTPMGNTISAAEQAIALLFATARNTARADRLMQQGEWAKKQLVGVEVHGKALGLVGLGKIGSHVARVMKAAGMEILAYDPFLSAERAKQMGVELVELDDLIARADFISLHTPLTDKTRNLLSRERLAATRKGVRIVNCARGGILDETALADLVKEGHIAAAGLDVFAEEPTTVGPLFGVKDITLTPHLGASTEEAEERCGVQMAEQVIAYFQSGEIRNAVNLDMTIDTSLAPYVAVARAMGTLAATLLDGAVDRVEVACAGELEEKDTGQITAAAVQGMLQSFGPEDVNIVNAFHMAKARGIDISATDGVGGATYRNQVKVTVSGGGRSLGVGGTAYDGQHPVIIEIDGFDMDLHLAEHLLVMQYPDKPGFVGKFGSVLAGHDVNIAGMQVGRMEKRGRAIVALTLDEKPDEATLEEIRAIDEVQSAHLVTL